MSETTVDLLIRELDTEYHTARGRLNSAIERRIAERLRKHLPTATEVMYDSERTDDGLGWNVNVSGVLADNDDLLLDHKGDLGEAMPEDEAQEVERDLEWLCDVDYQYAETTSLYLPEQVA